VTNRQILASMMRKLETRSQLSDTDRAAILALPCREETREPGSTIVREGDRAESCCVLLSGFAYRSKVTGDGGRQIVSIQLAGEIVDLHNALLGVADHSVQMLTRGNVAFIPRSAIQELAFSLPAVGRALWLETLVDGSVYREWIMNVGRRDARTRLAHLLCELTVRLKAAGLGDGNGYHLPLTQEQLADATGLTPVHVNRMIQSLRSQQLIGGNQRSIVIEDWEGLQLAGDFNPAYLHSETIQGHSD